MGYNIYPGIFMDSIRTSNIRVFTADLAINTAQLVDGLYCHNSCQTSESLSEQGVQTKPLFQNNCSYSLTSLDVTRASRELIDFLAKTAPLVLEELELPQFPILQSQRSKRGKAILEKCIDIPSKLNGLEVTGIDWNTSGSLLVVSYGILCTDAAWSKDQGGIALFDFHPNRTNENKLETRFVEEHCCSMMCVAAHPKHPSIFAFGNYSGQVLLYDFDKDIPFVSNSRLDEYCHNNAVISISWKFINSQEWVIISLCTSGKMLVWSPSNLKHPLQGHHIELLSDSKKNIPLGGATFKVSVNDYCIVGTESGILINVDVIKPLSTKLSSMNTSLKWSTNAIRAISRVSSGKINNIIARIESKAVKDKKRGVDFATVYSSQIEPHVLFPTSHIQSYKPHIGQVTAIDFCPGNQSLFVTSGTDGELRLYFDSESEPQLTLDPSKQTTVFSRNALYDTKFNKTGSVSFYISSVNIKDVVAQVHYIIILAEVVACVSEDGCCYIIDMTRPTKAPYCLCPQPQLHRNGRAQRISLTSRMITVGYRNGTICVWRLPSNKVKGDKKMLSALDQIF